MLLGFNLQKYNSVACSVALTNAVSMCDRTPKRAATFFWPLGAQTTATNVTFTITGLAPFVAKAGMVLGLIGIAPGTKVTVGGIKASDGSTVALGGNSTTQRAVASGTGTVAVYWQFDDGLPLISGYTITVYNDVNGATGIVAGAQCGIGEAGVCPAVWIDHEPGMVSGRVRMGRFQRTLSGAINYVSRATYRKVAMRPTFGTDSDWRQSALPNGMDFEQLLTAVADDPYVLVFDTTDPTVMQRSGLFGICTKAPDIVGLTGPYAQFEQFEFEEIVSGNSGSAASAPPITSDSTRFLRADGSWSNVLTGPITVTGIVVSGLTGYVKANGAGAATASATVPTADLSGTLLAAQMPALAGDLSHVAGTLTPTVAKIRGVNVAATAPTNGQALVYDSGSLSWKPGSIGTGAITGLGTASTHADTDYVHIAGAETMSGVKTIQLGTSANTKFGAQRQLILAPMSASGLGLGSYINMAATFCSGWGGTDFAERYSGGIGYLPHETSANPRNKRIALFTSNNAGDVPVEAFSASNVNGNISNVALKINGTLGPQNFQGSGTGLELIYDGTDSIVQAFNRTSTAWAPLVLNGSSISFGGIATGVVLDSAGSLNFGSVTRQMINLFSTAYAIGVQSSTLFLRTQFGFNVYRNGVYSPTQNDPGSGGSTLMSLDSSGNMTLGGTLAAAAIPNTTVTPGSYTSANLTIGADGRILAASNGSSAPTIPTTPYNVGTTSASQSLNFAANGTYLYGSQVRQKMKLGANTTFTFTAPSVLSSIVLYITNGSSAYTATWPASVKWPGGIAPSMGAAGALTIVTLSYDGANYQGAAMGPNS